jgi:predicted nuclease with TOPRIM domain
MELAKLQSLVPLSEYQELKKDLTEAHQKIIEDHQRNFKLLGELEDAKAIIQRQAELISYFINEYPQTKDLAKIKAAFGGEVAEKKEAVK